MACSYWAQLLLLLLVTCVQSKLLYIASNGTDSVTCGEFQSSACSSLRQCVANGATLVSFEPGHYYWTEAVNLTTPLLTLFAETPDSVLINCQGNTEWTLNVVDLNITGLTFSGCYKAAGIPQGALRIVAMNVVLSHLLFFNNSAAGGFVFVSSSNAAIVANCGFLSSTGTALSVTAPNVVLAGTVFANITAENEFSVLVASKDTVVIDACTFVSNRGNGALSVVGPSFTLSRSLFADNSAAGAFSAGGAVNVDSTGSAVIDSCVFTGNSAESMFALSSYAGALNVKNTADVVTTVTVSNCSFTENYGATGVGTAGGGAIQIYSIVSASEVLVSGCTFINNVCSIPGLMGYGGGIYVSNYGAASVTISNCTFVANIGEGGGIYVSASPVVISNCNFTANTGGVVGGGAVLFNGYSLDMTLCFMSANTARDGSGGAILLQGAPPSAHQFSTTVVTIAGCDVDASIASNGGAVSANGPITVSFIGCTMSDNSATYGGALHFSDGIIVSMHSCSLVNNAAEFGAGIFIEDSSVTIIDMSASGSKAATFGGDVLAVLAAGLQIQKGNFSSGYAGTAGGSIALFFTNANLDQLVFSGAAAPLGGALFVDPSSNVSVTRCFFMQNTASFQGGAADIQGSAWVSDTRFVSNRALNGAALAMSSNITSTSWRASVMLSCANCSFQDNHATFGGGCMYWLGTGLEPLCVNCTFADSNTAAYGFWNATPAIQLLAVAPTTVSRNSSVAVAATLQDWYDQPVVTVPVPVLTSVLPTAQVIDGADMPDGTTVAVVAVSGLNTAVQLQLQASIFTCNALTVLLGSCAQGYGYTNDRCVRCDAGTYTYNTTGVCQPCNAPLVCGGGRSVLIQPDYWPNINTSTGLVEGLLCPFDFCDGLGNIFTLSGVCNPQLNRNGSSPLCGECLPGFSEWSHKCVPCNGTHGGAIAIQLLQLAGIVLLQRILSQSSSGATGFVMLVFVYQFASLALYPKPLLQLLLNWFQLNLPAGTLGCPFAASGYGQLAAAMITPLICIAMVGLFYLANVGMGKLLAVRWPQALPTRFLVATGTKDTYIRTLVVLCLNMYETVLEAAFNFLVCVQGVYNDVNVVYLYPSVSCNDALYGSVRILLVILIAVFVLGPAVIFVWLHRQRRAHNGSLQHLEHRYGRLFAEYKPSLYFWECIALWRRAVLLAVFVPIAGQSLGSAKAALLATVMIFGALQHLLRPFQQDRDNTLESISLLTLAVLIGLFSNDNVNLTLQSYLGGTLLIVTGLVLVAPSVFAAVRSAVQIVRQGKSAIQGSQEATLMRTPLI